MLKKFTITDLRAAIALPETAERLFLSRNEEQQVIVQDGRIFVGDWWKGHPHDERGASKAGNRATDHEVNKKLYVVLPQAGVKKARNRFPGLQAH